MNSHGVYHLNETSYSSTFVIVLFFFLYFTESNLGFFSFFSHWPMFFGVKGLNNIVITLSILTHRQDLFMQYP